MVENKKRSIRWNEEAYADLEKLYDYIKKDSPQNAKHVAATLVQLTRSLETLSERYPKEELLAELDGNFRSVVKWSYKIIYEVTDEVVIILKIFNTHQSPTRLIESLKKRK